MKGEYRQVVKLAQPGVRRAYVVFEHQLDLLAQGSPASLLLNFALFFLGVASTSLGTLVTALRLGCLTRVHLLTFGWAAIGHQKLDSAPQTVALASRRVRRAKSDS